MEKVELYIGETGYNRFCNHTLTIYELLRMAHHDESISYQEGETYSYKITIEIGEV